MPGGSKNKAVPQRNRNQGMKHVGDRARALPTSAQSYNTQRGGTSRTDEHNSQAQQRVPVKEHSIMMRHIKGQIRKPACRLTLKLGLVISR